MRDRVRLDGRGPRRAVARVGGKSLAARSGQFLTQACRAAGLRGLVPLRPGEYASVRPGLASRRSSRVEGGIPRGTVFGEVWCGSRTGARTVAHDQQRRVAQQRIAVSFRWASRPPRGPCACPCNSPGEVTAHPDSPTLRHRLALRRPSSKASHSPVWVGVVGRWG